MLPFLLTSKGTFGRMSNLTLVTLALLFKMWTTMPIIVLHKPCKGMDLDTYPGCSMVADLHPVGLFTGSYEDNLMRELVNLALEIYNKDESNVFEYRFLKIKKANLRLTGYLEFFMTVKFLNVTLGTVIETFQIYAGRSMDRRHVEVFSCVPKAGALV